MDDTYSIIKDVMSTSNANIVVDIKNKIEDIILLLYENNKNKIAINLLKNITIMINTIIKNINDNSCKLNTILKNMSNMNTQINIINNKIDKITENKGIKNLSTATYVGELKNGIREGKWVLYYNSGDKYEGDWKNDEANGKGILYYANGDKYDGDFKNNKKEGKGIFYFANGEFKGDRNEGDWKNDKREGSGAYYCNDGDRVIGNYKDDNRIGIFAKLCKSGKVEAIEY